VCFISKVENATCSDLYLCVIGLGGVGHLYAPSMVKWIGLYLHVYPCVCYSPTENLTGIPIGMRLGSHWDEIGIPVSSQQDSGLCPPGILVEILVPLL